MLTQKESPEERRQLNSKIKQSQARTAEIHV